MRLYLDACCIIYAIEGLPQFRDPVVARLTQVESRPDGLLITSRLSRLECRTKPLRNQQQDVLGYYDGFFSRKPLVVTEISAAVIDRATALRAAHGFKTPDAIHLATAIEEKADVFLTGDAALARCPNLRVELI
jgi:predicted nucleic acid-binding protein